MLFKVRQYIQKQNIVYTLVVYVYVVYIIYVSVLKAENSCT